MPMDQLAAAQRPITITLPEGTWTLKTPTFGVYLAADGRAAQKLEAPLDHVSSNARLLAQNVALVELCTLQGPPGWDWDAQPDADVLNRLVAEWGTQRAAFKSGVGPAEGSGSPPG